MSASVLALVLIRLEERAGDFVGVHELADHYGLAQDLVRRELQTLSDQGHVQCMLQSDGAGPGEIISAIKLAEAE